MNGTNEQRKLAPDTRWILSAIGAILAVLVGVFQYQLNQAEKQLMQQAELTLSRARENVVTLDVLQTALVARDARLTDMNAEVNALHVGRAKHQEALANIQMQLQRVIDLSIRTNDQSTKTSQQIKNIMAQADANRKLAERLLEQR